MTACKIDGCERPVRTMGWCNAHHLRYSRHGDPLAGAPPLYSNPDDAIAARTQRSGDCLVWTGSRDGTGYGQLRINDKLVKAHRYVWAREHGPIPDGLYVDHKCWNKACVNIAHLRLATHGENVQYQARVRKDNRTGYRGVYKKRDTYTARATKDGVTRSKGGFPTPEAAAIVAQQFREEMFGDFAGKG